MKSTRVSWQLLIFTPAFFMLILANAKLAGIYPYFVFLAVYCLVLLANTSFLVTTVGYSILATVTLFLLVLLLCSSSTFYSSYLDYYIWPFLFLGSWPVLVLIAKVESIDTRVFVGWMILLIVILVPFIDLSAGVNALFGANMLYRFTLLFFGVFGWRLAREKKYLKLTWLALAFFPVFDFIDSRAGQAIFLFVYLSLLLGAVVPKWQTAFKLFSLTVLLLLFAGLQEFFAFLGYFGINLSIHNASEAWRLEQWEHFFALDWLGWSKTTIGELYSMFSGYPHSIVLEGYFYHGFIFGSLLLLINLFVLYRTLWFSKNLWLVGFVAGAQFSGDLRDNFIIFTIFLAYLMQMNLSLLRRRGNEKFMVANTVILGR